MSDARPINDAARSSSSVCGSDAAPLATGSPLGATAGLPSSAGVGDSLDLAGRNGPHAAPSLSTTSSPVPAALLPPAKPRRRFRQFGLRTLLILMALCAAAFAWYSHEIGRYKRQAVAIQKLEKLGAVVDLESDRDVWLARVTSDMEFYRATGVSFDDPRTSPISPLSDSDLARLDDLIGVEHLWLTGQSKLSAAGFAHLANQRTLTVLDLDSTTFTGDALQSIAKLPALKELYLYRTPITDDALRHLARLTTLRGLDISETSINGPGLAALSRLHKLELLNLSKTKIDDAALGHLSGLTNIKWLDCADTRVTDAGLRHLTALTNLKRLDLSGTKVVGPGLAHVKSDQSRFELDLNNTPFEGSALVHLAGLTKLYSLKLSRTLVDDDDLAHLAKISTLEVLELDYTNVQGDGLRYLAGLPLFFLSLRGTPWGDSQLAALPHLPKLQLLVASNTDFGDLGARRVCSACPHLERLMLDDTFVTAAGIRELLTLPKLTNLSLEGVAVTADEAIALEQFRIDIIHPRDPGELRKYQELKTRSAAAAP